MSTLYTRRTALTALGMGAATLLAACSSNSSESVFLAECDYRIFERKHDSFRLRRTHSGGDDHR